MHILEVIKSPIHPLPICLHILPVSMESRRLPIQSTMSILNGISNATNIALTVSFAIWNTVSTTESLRSTMIMATDRPVITLPILHLHICPLPTACILVPIKLRYPQI